jgi:hypothetical protein
MYSTMGKSQLGHDDKHLQMTPLPEDSWFLLLVLSPVARALGTLLAATG